MVSVLSWPKPQMVYAMIAQAKPMDLQQKNSAQDISGPLALNAFGETYLYKLNRNSFNKIDSRNTFDQTFLRSFLNPNTFNVVIGTDSGLLPKYLLAKGIPDGSRYIFIEPEAILISLTKHELLPKQNDRIIYTSPGQWEICAKELTIENYFYINAVRSHNALCVRESDIAEYSELSWQITERLEQLNWEHAMTLTGESFIEQQLNNLADNQFPASILCEKFENHSVIILAGGPSLTEALPWVSRHQDRIVIFAVSRIARQLQQHNIEPDFIFSVDPNDLSFDISKEVFHFSNKPVFVHAFHCVSTLTNQWHSAKLYIGPRFPWKTPLDPNNFYGSGPTVTNTAITTAQEWGFKNIILAGVDLCFTREGITHASGSNEDKAGPRFDLTGLQVETNDGGLAPTSSDFFSSIQVLCNQAQKGKQLGCQMFNTAAKAAKVEDIDLITFEDIPLTNAEISPRALIDFEIERFIQGKDFHSTDKILQEINRTTHAIKTIKKVAKSAKTLNENMYNEAGLIENHTDKRYLDKLEKKLQRKYPEINQLIKRFGIREFIKITKPFDEELTAEQAKELGRVYYDAYLYGCNKLQNLIAEAKQRLLIRLEEQSRNPNFPQLLKQWQKDHSYRRAQLWQTQHPDCSIPPQYQAEWKNCLNQYTKILAEQNTQHLKRAQSHGSLRNLFQRARLLLSHQKINDLHNLNAALKKSKHDPLEITLYSTLIDAYLYELTGETKLALQNYQYLIESTDQSLIEEGLLRISLISLELEEYNNAYLALQCLSQLNLSYIPQYAEICRLLEKIPEATESYCRYILEFPDDLFNQMKLAQIYLQNEDYERANVLIEHVIAKEPTSQTAWLLKNEIDQKLIHKL